MWSKISILTRWEKDIHTQTKKRYLKWCHCLEIPKMPGLVSASLLLLSFFLFLPYYCSWAAIPCASQPWRPVFLLYIVPSCCLLPSDEIRMNQKWKLHPILKLSQKAFSASSDITYRHDGQWVLYYVEPPFLFHL